MRIFVAAAVALGLGAAVAAAQGGGAGPVAVTQPWARATPGMSKIGAVYLTLRSPRADALLAAATPVAKEAQLHEMEMSGMVMKMRPLKSVALPAGHPVVFAPGGMHIMLTGLKAPLRAGESFPLTLTFAKAGEETVTVPVAKAGAMGPPAAAH
jgi:periplasmic copper chaperone A